MTRSNTRGDPAVEQQRHDLAETTSQRRKKCDSFRGEQRELQDRSRHGSQRGDVQALASLRRQRAAIDRDIREERQSADISLAREHALSDATLLHAKEARSSAEAETTLGRDREESRTRELEETLALFEDQLRLVSARLGSMLDDVPRGAFREHLCDDVTTVRVATERMRTLLEAVLTPECRRPKADSRGGSG